MSDRLAVVDTASELQIGIAIFAMRGRSPDNGTKTAVV